MPRPNDPLFHLVVLLTVLQGCGGEGTGVDAPVVPDPTDPPSIVAQPRDTTVSSGETALFRVRATGTRPLTFQWLRDREPVTGANDSVHVTPLLTIADSGSAWAVEVGNVAGSVTSRTATLTVLRPDPPEIVAHPASQTVQSGEPATFRVRAWGAPPLTFQWLRDGEPVPGASDSVFVTPPATRPDSAVAYEVTVSNDGGSVTSDPAVLTVVGTEVYGLGGFRVLHGEGPNDLVGLRYRFKVVANESPTIKIVFGFNRFHRPGSNLTYLIEANVYADGRRFEDGACTTWPLAGSYVASEASLRIAVPDYNFAAGNQPGITTGIRTGDPEGYPVQTYLIDDISGLYKSDAISQADMNGREVSVAIERADTLRDTSAFDRCGRRLESGLYRRWVVRTQVSGGEETVVDFLLPESGARYATVHEALNFASEFIHTPGRFTVQYWGFESMRESDLVWRERREFVTSALYDGNGRDFGVRVVEVDGSPRVELSNERGGPFLYGNVRFGY